MKVIFKGSPEKVRRQMNDFLNGSMVAEVEEPAEEVQEEVQEEVAESAEEEEQEHVIKPICQFCNNYTANAGWVRRHEQHCKSNPERTPHPKEGKTMPWMKSETKN